LTRREYALMACAAGAAVLALLPVLLHRFGTSWRPGVPTRRRDTEREKKAGSDRLSATEAV
jgi:Ca-activated chloride channel homolog